MAKKLITLICLVAMTAAFMGCEKKIDGVPASKALSELSEEEQASFCTYLGDTFEEMIGGDAFKESMCLTMSASFAGFEADNEEDQVAACEENYEECMAEEEEPQDFDSDEICPSADELAGCTATMAEVDACYKAMIASQKEEAAKATQYTCSELIIDGKMEELQGDENSGPPEECQAIQESCPAILG